MVKQVSGAPANADKNASLNIESMLLEIKVRADLPYPRKPFDKVSVTPES